MNTVFKHYVVLLCFAGPLLAGCDAMAGKKDYAYFRAHLDEAKSVADECQLNGTSGMDQDKISQCDSARQAYGNRKLTY